MSGAAAISDCGRYRYSLTRELGGTGVGRCNFVMLNPSTADAAEDDPTIRRCMRFAREWGYEALVVTNLFALRSTDPAALKVARDPVGPLNDRHLIEEATAATLVVCAWGAGGALLGRGSVVREMLSASPLWHLRETSAGHPGHPLYLPRNLEPVRWL